MSLSGKKVLILGTVWPEPDSSAAGMRMMQLIDFLLGQQCKVSFGSPAARSDHSEDLQAKEIDTYVIHMNDPSFDDLIQDLQPEVVIFDRFMTEEQFGWRVATQCPDALRILDSEDLHFLRKGRALRKEAYGKPEDLYHYLLSEMAMRELSSIYRCDLTLIISEFEMDLLIRKAGIPGNLLQYLPIGMIPHPSASLPPFEQRQGFVSIGNFRHPPNRDSIRYLKDEIWPLIRKKLPDAQMHVYGAYASAADMQLNDMSQGFSVHGRADSEMEVLRKHRVTLSPLRFGAGLKGKFLNAFRNGLPAVTTPVGAEGIAGESEWAGRIASEPEEIAAAAVDLHRKAGLWTQSAEKGEQILLSRFDPEQHFTTLREKINYILQGLQQHRDGHLTAKLLQYQRNRSTEFMSRWIHEKNKE